MADVLCADDTLLGPVGMTGKSVFDIGIDKQGLLVTIWGKVTYSYMNMYITAYDGSGTIDGDLIGNPGIPACTGDLAVPLDTLPPVEGGTYVAVTGVVGKATCMWAPSTVIRPRSAADIRVIH